MTKNTKSLSFRSEVQTALIRQATAFASFATDLLNNPGRIDPPVAYWRDSVSGGGKTHADS
jgi:hypothetical protein